MLVKPPRWVLAVEAVVVACAIVVLAYKVTLTNRAMVTYDDIRRELTYQSAAGEVLRGETADLPGSLEASGSREISGLEIGHVPRKSEIVLLRIVGARVVTKHVPTAD